MHMKKCAIVVTFMRLDLHRDVVIVDFPTVSVNVASLMVEDGSTVRVTTVRTLTPLVFVSLILVKVTFKQIFRWCVDSRLAYLS